MPILQILRNIAVTICSTWLIARYGPPIVDQYFPPTIGYVANAFVAIAPSPPPSTTLGVAPTPVILKTILTGSSNTRATMIVMNAGEGSGFHDGPSHWGGSLMYSFSTIFDWWMQFISELPRGVLLHLRRLFDSFINLASLLIAPFLSWQLARIHNQMVMERLTAAHEMEIAEANDESSTMLAARDFLIATLQGQIMAQGSHLSEVEAIVSAKIQAENQFKSEITTLGSKLIARDTKLARLTDDLAEAKTRADTAEASYKTMEKKAKAARSDHDSAIQKKENEVTKNKNAHEKAVEDRNQAWNELKAARAGTASDKKRITKLEKQAIDSAAIVSGLQDQLNEKDAVIGQKEGIVRRMREDATRSSKEAQKFKTTDRDHLRELQGQITKANKLREDAEAKASRKEQESKAKDDKIEDFKFSCAHRQRRIDSLELAHKELQVAHDKEQAEARDAATKAQDTEEELRKRVAELEEQIRSMSASSNVAPPKSDASPQEQSTSSPSHPIVPPSGPRRSRYVPPTNGGIFSNPEAKGLPANTPRGPKGGRGGSRG